MKLPQHFRRYAPTFLLALSLTSTRAELPLVNPGDEWRYRKGTSAPQPDWLHMADTKLDATWLMGRGSFGYADTAAETQLCQTLLDDMRGEYTTVAIRRSFNIEAEVEPTLHLRLTVDYDDGFIAWLDGVFLASANSPGSPAQPAYKDLATGNHESSRGSGGNPPVIFDLGPVGSRLAQGSHLLAMVGLNQSSTSSDCVLGAALSLVVDQPPPTNCVSGLLAVDSVLKSADSPYRICGNLTVAGSTTLTIEAGTWIQIDPGVDLTVSAGGRIVAEGTETSRIRFTQVPDKAAWGGIILLGSEDPPESRFTYVDFDGNGRTCMEVDGGNVILEQVTFGATRRPYLSLDRSSFLISHCYFPSSSAAFELVHGTGGIKAGGRGIIRDCFFGTTSGYNDIIDFTGGNRPSQPILQLYNNVFTGATDDILDLDGTDAWIEGNIFLHAHRNGAPDSAAAVSGGSSGGAKSEITIVGNLFFDCDQAVTAKQGNFYVILNNTLVRMTKTGGSDTAAGAVNVRDLDPTPSTFAAGLYLEGNIIVDAEQLVRNYEASETTVLMVNNILPAAWEGPGTNNFVGDPMLRYLPQLTETLFTNWTDAQVLREWFGLLPGSPALATGPGRRDQGGLVPLGVSVSGEPNGSTTDDFARLSVGENRPLHDAQAVGWPEGAGYIKYRWRLDGNAWSPETPITAPILLTNLAPGTHQVAVAGKNDAGTYQDDRALGTNAVVSFSRVWTVQAPVKFTGVSCRGETRLFFKGQAGGLFAVEYKDALDATEWLKLSEVAADVETGVASVVDPGVPARRRFYRVVALGQK